MKPLRVTGLQTRRRYRESQALDGFGYTCCEWAAGRLWDEEIVTMLAEIAMLLKGF
jgi:hypothetical protein